MSLQTHVRHITLPRRQKRSQLDRLCIRGDWDANLASDAQSHQLAAFACKASITGTLQLSSERENHDDLKALTLRPTRVLLYLLLDKIFALSFTTRAFISALCLCRSVGCRQTLSVPRVPHALSSLSSSSSCCS